MFERAIATWGRLFGWGQETSVEEDRRVWQRQPCDIDTVCQRAGDPDATPLRVRVRNVSVGGIRFLVEQSFDLGELLGVVLPGAGREAPTSVLACVVRVDDEGGGRWTLGCTFSDELTEDDLNRFAPGSPRVAEQRAWERYPSHAHATYQRVNDAVPGTRTARVRNLSISGVALEADAPLPVGELLNVELRDDAGSLIVAALACVVRVTGRPGGDWLFGCNFMSELSEEQLRTLV
jgi:hypothetical protein